MAKFTIISWNVETFGETKLKTAADFISTVAMHYDADLIAFLEPTKYGQTDIYASLSEVLKAKTNVDWVAAASDPTFKFGELPLIIPFKDFSKAIDRKSYNRDLLLCYAEGQTQYTLKPPPQQQRKSEVAEALQRAGILRPDIETYIGFMRYNHVIQGPDISPRYLAPNTYLGLTPGFSRLESRDAADTEIGYQDPGSVFNGRRPYIYQMFAADANDLTRVSAWFSFVHMHAPFGDNVGNRVPAVAGLLNLRSLDQNGAGYSNLVTQPLAVVAGDFNVNYKYPNDYHTLTLPIPDSKTNSARAYAPYILEGFDILITEQTSLKKPKDVDPKWTISTDFRASAYDNIMVKGIDQTKKVQAKALDLIDDTYTQTGGNGYLKNVNGMPQIKKMYDAYTYYQKNISDHLPVLYSFNIQDRP